MSNVFIGKDCGYNYTGNCNISIGYLAGGNITTGNCNTYYGLTEIELAQYKAIKIRAEREKKFKRIGFM